MNHDGRDESEEEAGHLGMDGPHDSAEAEYPGTEADGGSDQRSDERGFHRSVSGTTKCGDSFRRMRIIIGRGASLWNFRCERRFSRHLCAGLLVASLRDLRCILDFAVLSGQASSVLEKGPTDSQKARMDGAQADEIGHTAPGRLVGFS